MNCRAKLQNRKSKSLKFSELQLEGSPFNKEDITKAYKIFKKENPEYKVVSVLNTMAS
jgi:hypothetical protein